jgi:1,4-alpha-glucan branching enzyme
MDAYLSLILHAHLPYVRHPEHERFLEENWLFEAMSECYIPLLWRLQDWERDQIEARLTICLSPTLCSMLLDPLLQERFLRYLENALELAEQEVHRTTWDPHLHPLAQFYQERFQRVHQSYLACHHNLLRRFAHFQENGCLEIITTAATHALLPLFQNHPPTVRAQVLVARDHYRSCFGRDPRGIWLPECAYASGVEESLREANIRWFVMETHGVLHAQPRPRFGVYAPLFTPNGVAVFARDIDSARQVWSKQEGYPGDPVYRDFYRDIGYDLEYEYLKPHLPAPPHRSFTGIKYHAITSSSVEKQPYSRQAALQKAAAHASHFLQARQTQAAKIGELLDKPPLLVAPYDAELFGHWWFEGPEFLDFLVRATVHEQNKIKLTTPEEYLKIHPTHQVSQPGASSWGEEGYWKAWLNETNEWIFPHLQVAQERMTELARLYPNATGLTERALKQAAREILLAQASDWPFILRTGTSPGYARQRIKDHLLRFLALHEQLTSTRIDQGWLGQIEWLDSIFPEVNYHYWR